MITRKWNLSLKDNRITIRLQQKNLEKFLEWQKEYVTMSAYFNHILTTYYKKNERTTWKSW